MSGTARAGVFVYAKDVSRMAGFYRVTLQMDLIRDTPELVVLSSPDMQLVIHAVPAEIASEIQIESPPVRREDAAMKFFYTVRSIDASGEQAAALGGQVFAERWSGPGFIVCNAMDPEGNVFQLRESSA